LSKKILFITGTRADFGKLKPVMNKVKQDPDYELLIFVTGMHMLQKYGFTVLEIRKAGFTDNIISYFNNQASGLDLILAETIKGLNGVIKEMEVDLVVCHGDRVEALAGAIVGSMNNILTAHIEGGEVSGTIDGVIRHAVTKLAHVHFVANKQARLRLIQMGERKESIYVIGSPEVDVMLSGDLPTIEEVKLKYGISFNEYLIFIYHPVVTELDKIERNMRYTIKALKNSVKNYVVIYPNNDSGSEVIIKYIDELKEDRYFRVIPSMRFEYFLTLLKNAKAIVGNSSVGVREASVYGVSAVNLGTRQENRNSCPTIINCSERDLYEHAILARMPVKGRPDFSFGNGGSAELFIDCLKSDGFWNVSKQKVFVDRGDTDEYICNYSGQGRVEEVTA
jgi:UDP-N-acetylglucosamine 2-epimerase (hydrolysing)